MRGFRTRVVFMLSCLLWMGASPAVPQGKITEILPGLIQALKSHDSLVREAAAVSLGNLGPAARDAIHPLVTLLADRDPYVSGRAAEALAKIGGEALAPLRRMLADTNGSVRFSAAIALWKMKDRRALPALLTGLRDADERVRWTSAVAIGDIGDRSAVPALAALLPDRDEDVRIAAAAALERVAPDFSGGDRARLPAVVDSLVPCLMQELRVPGVSIAVIQDRKLAWTRHFGYADAARKSPVRDTTLFEACSMSKPVFASVVLKMVEEGTIGLDVPLSRYLRDLPADLRPITARMALSHTSGLPNWRKGDEERDGPLTTAFTPGARFSYSGEGIFLLQRALEDITGEPLDRLAARRLFQPLGLSSCSYVWTETLDRQIASGHDSNGEFLQKTSYVHPNAAYSLYVSAADYARLIVEILKVDRSSPHSLSVRSIDTMLTPHIRLDSRDPIVRPGKGRGRSVFWGLGWSINTTAAGSIAHHSGANRSGFRCFCQFSRERGTGIVIMTNSTNGGELWARLIARVGDL